MSECLCISECVPIGALAACVCGECETVHKKRPTGHTLWREKEIYGRHTFVLFVR